MTTLAERRGSPDSDASTPNENSIAVRSLCVPERSRTERYLALALFAFSFFYLCLFRHFTTMEPDEGVVLQGAQRILAGQVPYRDFFSFYTRAPTMRRRCYFASLGVRWWSPEPRWLWSERLFRC